MVNTQKLYAEVVRVAKLFAARFGVAGTWTAKQTFQNYTVLGDATIKVKSLTGTTDAVAGNSVNIAHGVTLGKIISIVCLVEAGSVIYPPNSGVTELFTFTADSTNLIVTNGAAATTTLNSPIRATVIYEE